MRESDKLMALATLTKILQSIGFEGDNPQDIIGQTCEVTFAKEELVIATITGLYYEAGSRTVTLNLSDNGSKIKTIIGVKKGWFHGPGMTATVKIYKKHSLPKNVRLFLALAEELETKVRNTYTWKSRWEYIFDGPNGISSKIKETEVLIIPPATFEARSTCERMVNKYLDLVRAKVASIRQD